MKKIFAKLKELNGPQTLPQDREALSQFVSGVTHFDAKPLLTKKSINKLKPFWWALDSSLPFVLLLRCSSWHETIVSKLVPESDKKTSDIGLAVYRVAPGIYNKCTSPINICHLRIYWSCYIPTHHECAIGVVVDGVEYSFGKHGPCAAERHFGPGEVWTATDAKAPRFHKFIPLETVPMSPRGVSRIFLDLVEGEWKDHSYNMLYHNCNDFTRAFLKR